MEFFLAVFTRSGLAQSRTRTLHIIHRSSTCPAGKYLNGATCTSCPIGTFTSSANSASSCTPCPAGSYASAATGSTSCTACAPGLYSAAIGAVDAATCKACPARFATGASAGATACTACVAGQWAMGLSTTCTSCVAGTYAAASGMREAPIAALNAMQCAHSHSFVSFFRARRRLD
jgi:hypothetical protein